MSFFHTFQVATIFYIFQSKLVKLGVLAQKSEFHVQLEEALSKSNCKLYETAK